MNEQLQYLGRVIQQRSSRLSAKLLDLPKDRPAFRIHSSQSGYTQRMQAEMFTLTGQYLSSGNEQVKRDLLTMINLYGEKSKHRIAALNQIMEFVYLSRSVIMDLFEEELLEGRITSEAIFHAMKVIDPLCLSISTEILHYYSDNLSTAKYELDESNKDLTMTLRELNDLKNALNEATVFSITDQDDRILSVNDRFCEASKYTREELIGQPHCILSSGHHPESFFKNITDTIKTGKIWKGEILNRAKDGSRYWVDTVIVPFSNKKGQTYQHIAIQHDITEAKYAEEMLRKMEKLSMIGELAAGIAHEIRNPLTTIKGFIQLNYEAEQTKEFSQIILAEIERINTIVSEFMVYARPHSVFFSECDAAGLLEDIVRFLKPEAMLNNVWFTTVIPDHECWISGEKNQLKQVFMNIIKNAIEAMPAGGEVRISLESDGCQVRISIEDTGDGLTEEQISRLGEPFFTTKSNGNGLGLMVSYKIIQNHQGTIAVNSQLNKGTAFHISLPVRCQIC